MQPRSVWATTFIVVQKVQSPPTASFCNFLGTPSYVIQEVTAASAAGFLDNPKRPYIPEYLAAFALRVTELPSADCHSLMVIHLSRMCCYDFKTEYLSLRTNPMPAV